jgi:hypothetical protein
MSWDVFICDFPKDAKTIKEIPQGWQPPAIGTRSEIINKLKEVAPTAKFTDSKWGSIEGDGYSIEILLEESDIQKHIALFVHGGENAVGAVASIIEHLGLRAVDSGSGDFFEPGQKGIEGFRRWAGFRDYVVAKHADPQK